MAPAEYVVILVISLETLRSASKKLQQNRGIREIVCMRGEASDDVIRAHDCRQGHQQPCSQISTFMVGGLICMLAVRVYAVPVYACFFLWLC